MQNLPVIITGLTSILMQIIVLRRLLTVFSGNELDIGITLSIWLIVVGLGSWFGFRHRTPKAFPLSFIIIGLLVQPTVLFTEFIPRIFSVQLGEAISLPIILIATTASLLPLCFSLGSQFPLAVVFLSNNTSRTYEFEAAGASLGGVLFTFFFAGRLTAFELATIIALFNIVIAYFLLRNPRILLLLIVPVLFHLGGDRIRNMAFPTEFNVLARMESKSGEITVTESHGQTNMYVGGQYHFSYPDVQHEEMTAHVPMTLHALPQQVLVIGGSPAVVREFLKYPLNRIDFVETDTGIVRTSLGLLTSEDQELLQQDRVRIHALDARKFIKTRAESVYDLVVFNLPEPATASINRFYSIEFLQELKKTMKPGAVLSMRLPISFGYISRSVQLANGSIYFTLKQVFERVALSSEESGFLFASSTDLNVLPGILSSRFKTRNIKTSSFYPAQFQDLFDPLKMRMVQERFASVKTANSDSRPIAYLYNLMIWSEVFGGRPLVALLSLTGPMAMVVVMIILVVLTAGVWRKKQAIAYAMFTTGFFGMTMTIVVLLAYQAACGFVYEALGLLSALFMGGGAMGAALARRGGHPHRMVKLLEISAILAAVVSPLFFSHEFLFYALSFLCGIIGGMQFSSLSLFSALQGTPHSAGRLYAIDLFGSFLGALVPAVALVPLFGIENTLWSVAVLKGSSLLALFSLDQEN